MSAFPIPINRKAGIFKMLAWLLKAGMTLLQALELLKQGRDRHTIGQLISRLIEGSSLSEAMAYTRKFRELDCSSVKAGEEAGALTDVLIQLSTMYDQEARIRKSIAEALVYPVIVLTTSIAAVGIMSAFVAPMFASMFNSTGQELPGLTKLLLSASSALPRLMLFLFLVTCSGMLLHFLLRKNRSYRLLISSMALRTPLLGSWIRNVTLHRISRNLAIMLGAGTTLERALQLMASPGLPLPYQAALEKVHLALLNGERIQEEIIRSKLFDPVFIHLVAAGENSGELTDALATLAIYYEEELRRQSVTLRTILEPVLIVATGLIVGTVVMGFYLPMFEMSTGLAK